MAFTRAGPIFLTQRANNTYDEKIDIQSFFS